MPRLRDNKAPAFATCHTMKHPSDQHTLELPEMPTPKKRGRPAILGRAMSAAERKRRSRSLQVGRATRDHNQRLPKALSVEIDASLHQKLKRYCEANGKTQIETLEQLIQTLPD
nr:RepB family protein [uncultured Deefgea sp.]